MDSIAVAIDGGTKVAASPVQVWTVIILGATLVAVGIYTVFTGRIMVATVRSSRFADYPVSSVRFRGYVPDIDVWRFEVVNNARLPLEVYLQVKLLWVVDSKVQFAIIAPRAYSGRTPWILPPGDQFLGGLSRSDAIFWLGIHESEYDKEGNEVRLHYSYRARPYVDGAEHLWSRTIEVQYFRRSDSESKEYWVPQVSPSESGIVTPPDEKCRQVEESEIGVAYRTAKQLFEGKPEGTKEVEE